MPSLNARIESAPKWCVLPPTWYVVGGCGGGGGAVVGWKSCGKGEEVPLKDTCGGGVGEGKLDLGVKVAMTGPAGGAPVC